jgi:hypothetical protein
MVPTAEIKDALTPVQALIYPLFTPMAVVPENRSQTVGDATLQLDWVYVDEARISINYTILGLNWPAGTQWDPMQIRISSPSIAESAYSGGGAWFASPVSGGMIAGSVDVFLIDGGLNAKKTPNINLNLTFPMEGPTSLGKFRLQVQVPVRDGTRIDNIDQTVVANNVSMTLKSMAIHPSYVEAYLCFQMPAPVDWGLTASKLIIGDIEYSFSGGGLLEGPRGQAFTLESPERCTSIGFDVAYDESASTVTLNVPRLMTSVPEVVDKERVARANERLADKGIEIDYINGDHSGRVVVLKRPGAATDAEIYPLIWDALADQHEGPWVFTVAIPK